MSEMRQGTLGDFVSQISGGGTPARDIAEYWTGKIPWISVKDLTSSNPESTAERISEYGLSSSASRLIPSGIPIVATRMAVGRTAVYSSDVAINQDLKAIFPNEELLHRKYLFHFLKANEETLSSKGTGSTVKGIRLEDLEQLPIYVPPLPEQKKIAEILSGIDKAINKILEAIEKSETTLTGVFANLDLIASSGKTATLGEVVRVQNGYAFQSSIFSEDPTDIPLVRISNISGGGVDIFKSKRIPRGLAPSDEYKVNRGDILIAMSGATTGKIGKYQGDAFCLLNQRVGKFVFRPGSDSAAYVTQLLLSGFLESRILAKAAGGAQPNISGKGIEDIDIPFPEAADQEKYGNAIKELLRVNSRRRIIVEKFQHLKASISSDLLSGRKRVSI